jgi:DNA-binding MarR family transcriptional regulator
MTKKTTLDKFISTLFIMRRNFIDRLACAQNIPDQIPMLHLEVLRLIASSPGLSMHKVAQHFSVTPPSATSLVDILFKEGYITRIIDNKDRRLVRLQITPKGLKRLRQGQREMEVKMRGLFRALNDKEIKQLIRIMEKLSLALKNAKTAV